MSNVLILIISCDECVADKKGQTSVSNGKVKEERVSLNLHYQTFFEQQKNVIRHCYSCTIC